MKTMTFDCAHCDEPTVRANAAMPICPRCEKRICPVCGPTDCPELTVETIFVYGTLKRGQLRANVLADTNSKFLGEAKTAAEFTLFDTLRGYPALLHRGDTSVKGELYEVTAETLAELDLIEGHPNLYKRERLKLADGQMAWVYVWAGTMLGFGWNNIGEEW
jgi:gamma-glutamylcyclotransferase (GGCT)/AIG2-like uncharacterized protein YtfP